jgi:proteasome lid subunit RPN8/RPN11
MTGGQGTQHPGQSTSGGKSSPDAVSDVHANPPHSQTHGQADHTHIAISGELHDEIRDFAALQWPEECCGLLVAANTRPNEIKRVVFARNVATEPLKTFEIDPQTLIDTHRSAREKGETVVGCFHSHPNGHVLPSTRDRARADEDGFLWMIIATDHNGAGESGLFRIIHQGDQTASNNMVVRYFRRCQIIEANGHQ